MKRILKTGNSEIVEKKSRFIGIVLDIESPEDAMEKVNVIKKRYYDARHNCYAYICGEDGMEKRFSDDGEPSGTAGKPMLDILSGSGVTNCLVVVTRYFGGTLLGTGGLVKAYGSAAKEALENAVTTDVKTGMTCSVAADYSNIGKLQYIFSSMDISVTDTVYEENVLFNIIVETGEINRLEKVLTEEFSGKIELNKESVVQFYISDGSVVII